VIVGSYAAIGDSFSEGMGDELPDGSPRGWADLVALGLAAAHAAAGGSGFGYANFAIRGRLLGPILAEQLQPAIALGPELLTINGGGNDIMRPRVSVASTADRLVAAAGEATAAGIRVAIVSGGDPTRHIPLGPLIRARGDELAVAVRERLAGTGIAYIDNWSDAALTDLRYWSVDDCISTLSATPASPATCSRGSGSRCPRPRTPRTATAGPTSRAPAPPSTGGSTCCRGSAGASPVGRRVTGARRSGRRCCRSSCPGRSSAAATGAPRGLIAARASPR